MEGEKDGKGRGNDERISHYYQGELKSGEVVERVRETMG